MIISVKKTLSFFLVFLTFTFSALASTHSISPSVDSERRENACGNITSVGEKTLCYIRYDYNNTPSRCNENDNEPGVLCGGVVFRGTSDDINRDYYSWNPSPASVQSGGVSFSYLRKDSAFTQIAYSYDTGFIFYPVNFTPSTKDNTIKVLCGFPLDAWTNNRSDKGCGVQGAVSSSRPCAEQGINNASDWYDINYPAASYSGQYICGFTLYSADHTINTAKQFDAMIKSQILLKENSFNQQNELRLATWEQNKSDLPLEAFFYLKGSNSGLLSSQKDQREFYAQFGTFVPVIELTLPMAMGNDAMFNYNESDQVITL